MGNTLQYNYTIIIPHRDIPGLLRQCLDSIPHRDDVQIIVVDDNSDPKNVDFEHFPGLGEKNTEVYLTKKGKGAGYARNVGLKHAKGKWLIFADADDRFNNCLAEAMDKHLNSEADCIYFRITGGSYSPDVKQPDTVDGYLTAFKQYQQGNDESLRFEYSVVWAKFVKKKLVDKHNIRFSETMSGNDTLFSIKTSLYAQKRELSNLPIYCYYYRDGSLYHNNPNLVKEQTDRLRVALSVHKVTKDHHIGFLQDYALWTWQRIYSLNKWKAYLLLPSILFNYGPRYTIRTLARTYFNQ